MSGFEENPFGEPTVNDPFSDPSVKRAVGTNPAPRGIEDYNPFAEPGSQANTQQVRGASNPPLYGGYGATPIPATLPATNQDPPPPVYARSPQQTAPTTLSPSAEQQRAEEEWKARSEEEARRPAYPPNGNNWPPLPDKCCFQPCFYQDIDFEIQPNFQRIVRHLYYLWMFHGLVLLLNVVGGFVLLLADGEFTTFGLGILYFILFTPFSFVCWFRPAYKAFKTDSSINFMVFFFIFFFQLIVTGIQAIGIPGAGTCGIIKAIDSFGSSAKDTFVGILILLIAICYCIAVAGDLLLLSKIHRMYRSSPASMSKAQQEFTSTFLRNEHVQNAAGNVAASAVRAQMSNATQSRY
ncbi:secretory carrier-associated membrane protein 5 isoform X1 [Fopius arisanus]|uniref:Secretory carrier-associated membrane protein n=1 Tax=Fopius arisanus TaxID=64838 RepID=A0A9R1TFV4_9HYME|nr:PREDICTED: secretory carrier-associated membrane protein 5 isoform X1 [Fopius arisanus]